MDEIWIIGTLRGLSGGFHPFRALSGTGYKVSREQGCVPVKKVAYTVIADALPAGSQSYTPVNRRWPELLRG